MSRAGLSRPGRGGRRFGRVTDYVLTALLLAALIFVASRLERVSERASLGAATIHDGDTLTVGGQRIRLKGIDAPEYAQTCVAGGRSYQCGREARTALARMTAGKQVNCTGWELDQFDRLLGSCTVGAPPLDVNREMVRQGWAVSYGRYGAEEVSARNLKLGLWRGDFQRPRDWRDSHEMPRRADAAHDWWGGLTSWFRQVFWS